ncbi:hypothetical protein CHS0354_008917 [Potamilus streckersoni]|uniref:EF-hand domain-containing protein n=1 Tax=Potamilus streckersoni TaxID=2493646 RepID=A0AAE0RQQ0_9BIVA|nr:hypothetical protein CHS0354_008917 [Potamilus streckersoni]
MSADEDTELRDLVAQTLEANGVLGKIRAQLRASVFLALEEQESVQNKTPFLNHDLKKLLSTKEGRMIAGLVREFLEYFNLEFSLAVFDSEAGCGPNISEREGLAKELNIPGTDGPPKGPLLAEVLRITREEKITRVKTNNTEDLTNKQIADAKKKFEYYDKDKNGEIDKEELRELFMDMFPHFNRNMLDRYVNDEFRATDRDFSSSISFNEFLGMYKRLFLLCRSVVSGDVADIVTPRSPNKSTSSQHSKSQSSERSNVESKNHRNLENHVQHENGPKSLQDPATDTEEDPFFDDPLPVSGGYKKYGSKQDVSHPGSRRGTSKPSQIPVFSAKQSDTKDLKSSSHNMKSGVKSQGSGLSSLQGLPSLTGAQEKGPGRKPPETDVSENLRAMDKRMAELGLDGDPHDFEYEDDFQSEAQSLSTKSPRALNQARSQNGSIAEEIEEELDDVSVEGDDFLRSEKSGFDEITTDHTISQHESGFDYVEDLQ